ncbi:MAG: XrtA/PEP-CTERM system histidine kinase PrsK [Sphingomonadaceae bacterium]
MTIVLSTVGLLSHSVAAAGFAALGIRMMVSRDITTIRVAVGIAAFITAAWATAGVLAEIYDTGIGGWLIPMETLRSAAWIGVLLLYQQRMWGREKSRSSFLAAALLLLVIVFQLATGTSFRFEYLYRPLGEQPMMLVFVACRLLVAISGLVLLHNLYINSRSIEDITFRLFAVALGVLFAYDLNLYTIHFLIGVPNITLIDMRGAINALAVPLLFASFRNSHAPYFRMSRQVAFHTVSFTIIGAYLILMSVLAYGLRLTGGNWGVLLQVAFIAIALIVGVLILLSPRFRAELRVRISRNFFRYRYDYRLEWLRFIDTIDVGREAAANVMPIRERLVQAVAAVLDCRGGALLEPSDGGNYELTARWCWPGMESPPPDENQAIANYLAETGRIIDFEALRSEQMGDVDIAESGKAASHEGLTLPSWAQADDSLWLAVPLIHRECMNGILLLRHSLAKRDLNWEDYDLLRTLGRQGASYLAEAATQARMDEARSFDEFNRRFAFVMHDLKNIISQLALVARNAERHADNPEFRADMVATLQSSVVKMTDLMQLLGREIANKGDTDPAIIEQGEVEFSNLVATVVATMRRSHPAIRFDEPDNEVMFLGDAGRLEAMVCHLIQNAIDASAPDAPISVELLPEGDRFRLIVADQGEGMSESFIRNELFKPFRSTKDGGFGIGAFEVREIVRAHGGRIEVESRPREGSRFTVTLPRRQQEGKVVGYG